LRSRLALRAADAENVSAPNQAISVGLAAAGLEEGWMSDVRLEQPSHARALERRPICRSAVARRAEGMAATAIASDNFNILVKELTKAGLAETMSGSTPAERADESK
jgi:hypothetical protein